MSLKKIIVTIHLWLGLLSGLVVFIIAITGCIYAFQTEIKDLTRSYHFVEEQDSPFILPSKLRKIADKHLPDKHIHSILYEGKNKSAKAIYYSYEENYYDFVFLNPYTAEVLKVKDEYKDFFRIILDGHFYLWLPHKIGQPVAASATMVFVALLLSGLFLWWRRNRKGTKQGLYVKWDARWRRKNYDLHSVVGFYVMSIAMILALTGLIWGFEWFKKAVYYSTGGEKSFVYEEPGSDASDLSKATNEPAPDILYKLNKSKFPHAETIEVHFPEDETSSIMLAINTKSSLYWTTDYIYFDQYTLEEIPVDHIWSRLADASVADKIMRMNYDIHTGAILGLPGKILAFFASLLVASLPVTGFLIWIGRKKKQKRISKPVRDIDRASVVNIKGQKKAPLRILPRYPTTDRTK
jgi:uncharacterized iron-regulated membrane protein